MASRASPPAVAVVLLAAGASRRFGGIKQLHPVEGKPMVRHLAELALGSMAARVLVVLGAHKDAVAAALAGLALELIDNPDYESGQSTSVRRGLRAAQQSGAEAVLFLPADMPFLQTDTLNRLIATWQERRAAVVVPVYTGQRGAPVLFDRRLFAELARLEGDQGGRALFPAHAHEIVEIEVDADQGRDLDSPADLESDFAGPTVVKSARLR